MRLTKQDYIIRTLIDKDAAVHGNPILCGENFEHFNKMLGHRRKNTKSRKNQNFYLLWIAIPRIELTRVQNEIEQIFNRVRDLFLISQDINDGNFDTANYVQMLSSI